MGLGSVSDERFHRDPEHTPATRKDIEQLAAQLRREFSALRLYVQEQQRQLDAQGLRTHALNFRIERINKKLAAQSAENPHATHG